MRIMYCAMFAAVSAAICLAGPGRGPLAVSDGREMVRNDYRSIPFEKGAWGNDISLFLPFSWSVPGEGVYTYFSAAEQKYSDGVLWGLVQINGDKLVYHTYPLNPGTHIWFKPYQLFEVARKDGTTGLFYYECNWKQAHHPSRGEKIALINPIWYELCVDTNGAPLKKAVEGGCGAFFQSNAAESLSNVIPHRYRGPDAEIVTESSPAQKRLEECGRQVWSLTEEQKKQIAVLHRELVRKTYPHTVVSNVYIVAGDGNFDGRCDAYATTDLESKDGKTFMWTLYVAGGTQFSRCENSHIHTFRESERIYINPIVRAAKDSFFRFDRLHIPSYIMPVVPSTDGKPEVLDYIRYDGYVQEFRRQQGFGNASFRSSTAPGIYCVASLSDLFDEWAPIVRAERVKCETLIVP